MILAVGDKVTVKDKYVGKHEMIYNTWIELVKDQVYIVQEIRQDSAAVKILNWWWWVTWWNKLPQQQTGFILGELE